MAYKTPGVYINEVALFPPSVAQVETAIPAFVGYTEKAADPNDKSLANVPVRIKSLVEFQFLFGGEYVPESYKVVINGTAVDSVKPDKRFYLFDALRQFYDNGGGACYIVSVGLYKESIGFDALKGGFEKLKKVDEPTLLLSPDAVGLKNSSDDPDLAKFSDLQKELLTQCATLQDRFAILDILEGYLAEDVSNTPISNFRDKIGINNLSYGASYYPWVTTSYSYNISFRQLHLLNTSDPDTEIVGYDAYAKDDMEKGLIATLTQSLADTDATINGTAYLKALLLEYKTNIEKFDADVDNADVLESNITAYLNLLARVALSFSNAESQSLAGSDYRKEVNAIKANTDLTDAIVFLVSVEQNPATIANTIIPRDIDALYTPLEPDWLGNKTYATIDPDNTPFSPDKAGCLSMITALDDSTSKILNANQRLMDAVLNKTKLRRQGIAYLKDLLSTYRKNIDAGTDWNINITAWLNLLARVVLSFRNAEIQSLVGSDDYHREINAIKADHVLTDAIAFLVSVEKNPKTIANTIERKLAEVEALYSPLDDGWLTITVAGITTPTTFASINADNTDFPNDKAGSLSIINTLSSPATIILNAYQRLLDAAIHFEKQAESAVFAGHVFFRGVHDKTLEYMRTLPPSGTVAGIYASVDNSRGVWKAPANVSINSIVGPAVKIDSKDQEELNVHTTGKSVNAIRAFTGKGTLVWGARTLAGNDNEWRYVPVRRFFIMVEESTRKASEPFVFEPNDANTWIKVRAMIENFLILQWRAGALQGAKPDEAFYVRVGLNETMTSQDILEGNMIIEIGMAVVRPAEFIILRFSHKMQSGNG
jgi:hypothetical protein